MIHVPFAYCSLDDFGAAEPCSLPALLPAGAMRAGWEGTVSRWAGAGFTGCILALDVSFEVPGCISPSYVRWQEQLL